MATALRIERNENWMAGYSRKNLRDSYGEMLGAQSENFSLACDNGVFYYYHNSADMPIIIVPSVPGTTRIELYIPSQEMHDPRDSAHGMLKLDKMRKDLEAKGYSFEHAKLQKNDGFYYELSIPTNKASDLEKIARDCNSIIL